MVLFNVAELSNEVLAFLDKHYVLFSIFVGLFISWLLRRGTKPKDDDDDVVKSLEDLLARGTDPELCGGKTDTYRWTQGEDEVDVYVPVDRLDEGGTGKDGYDLDADADGGGAISLSAKPPVSKRDVVCRFGANKLYLSVRGKVIMDGKPYAAIDPDESTWQIERGDAQQGRGEKGDEVWVTLKKLKPTMKSMHWRCVVQGHPEINPRKFGPAVMTVDPNNPESMRRAMEGITPPK